MAPRTILRYSATMDLQTAKTIASQKGWLAHQSATFRDALLRRTALRSYDKGQYIYHLEDEPGMMFGIVEGAVLVGVSHPIVGLYIGHLGLSGDWYGEAAALHAVTRRVSIEAAVPLHILSLPINAVQEMIEEQPLWLRNFSALLLWNQATAIRTAVDLLIREPTARLTARLLTLSGVRVGQDLPMGPIELPLTQVQLATMSGLSRKSVHRALNALEAEGLCENRYGGIVVLSTEALEWSLMSLGSRAE